MLQKDKHHLKLHQQQSSDNQLDFSTAEVGDCKAIVAVPPARIIMIGQITGIWMDCLWIIQF